MKHLLTLLLLIFFFNTPASATDRISIVGSTTVLPIVAQAVKRYRHLHPNIVLTVSGGGSGVGVASVLQGTAQIGMVSRDLTEQEKNKFNNNVEVIPVARDAVAIAVSKAVYLAGVKLLSIEQIADIYRGKTGNWKSLGGADTPILVIDKEASRGTRHVFAKVVLGNARARARGASIITGSNNEEQAAIAGSNQAIGMLSNAWLNDQVRAIAIGTGHDAISLTTENIANGRYPIQRTLDILLPKNASRDARQFIDFLLSEEGQNIVQSAGYLPAH